MRTPVGSQLVLRPYVSFDLPPHAVLALHARKPRLSGSFVARIMTAPARGRSRTVVVVSRQVNGLALRASAVGSILGRQLGLREWALTRKQTQAVKRAAAQGPLALALSARYGVSYTNPRGRTVATPTRSGSTTLPLALKAQPARGANLRNLAATFRALLARTGQLKIACATRNTILGELRNTYSTMVAGDRSGAAGLLQAYERYTGIRVAAGLLTQQQATMLGSGLGGLLRRVGSGQSKRVEPAPRWPALPSCGLARAHIAAFGGKILALAARFLVMRIITYPIRYTRRTITHYFRDARNTEYPDDTSEPSIAGDVPAGDPTGAQPVLDDIKVQMDAYDSWAQCCIDTQPGQAFSAWNGLMNTFAQNRWRFEPSTTYYTLNDEITLLPLFAQYINLYLEALHEGIVYGPDWGLTPDTILGLEDTIRGELNPNAPSSGCKGLACPGPDAMSYTKRVYDAGLAQQGSSTDPQTNFNKTNQYKREMQLSVLDTRDSWHQEDAMDYPYGDPTFKLDQIVYSDEVGTTTHTFAVPANPASSLSALTAWTASYSNRNWLTAIQADNSPQVGARTGSTSTGTPTTYTVAPRTIAQVDATSDRVSSNSQQVIRGAKFYFSDGTTAVPGGGDLATTYGSTFSFAYEDEVLATAKIMGSYAADSSTGLGDALVLGFRRADSFAPTWHGSLPGPRHAPGTQACLGVEQVTITSGTHIGATTGSRAGGAALQMRNCSSTEWDQNWQYIDTLDSSDPDSAAAQHELTVYAGRMCMAPKTDASGNWATGGGFPTAPSTTWPPPPHTLVAVYDCNETSAQKWTVNTDGTIRPESAGNLCLARSNGATAPGTAIQLDTCSTGSTAQQWSRP